MADRGGRQLSLDDLFEIPKPADGSLDFDAELSAQLSHAVDDSPLRRDQIAKRMGELLNREITKWMIDAWTAPSRHGHRFPLAYLPAFEEACETHRITHWLCEKRGCTAVVGEETLDLYLGRLERERKELDAQIKKLKNATKVE